MHVKETVNSVPGQAIPGYSVGAKLAAGGLVLLHVSRNPIQELPHADSADSSFMDSTFQTKTEQVMFTEGVISCCLYVCVTFHDFVHQDYKKNNFSLHLFSRDSYTSIFSSENPLCSVRARY